MKEADFMNYLVSASYLAVNFAERFVKNKMRYEFKYLLRLNQSCDHDATDENDLYPEDKEKEIFCESYREAATILCRNDKIPEWIDIKVHRVNKEFTLLELLCCGRFTGIKENFYYDSRGQGPFGIKSPKFPPYYDPESGRKFKIPKFEQGSGGGISTSSAGRNPSR